MNDPVKAMSVPMLKKDLEDPQDREKSDPSAVRAEDDRFATFQQWFMALIVGTIVSVLALAATIIWMTVKFTKRTV
jgi:flagellar biogenesis protein FliO